MQAADFGYGGHDLRPDPDPAWVVERPSRSHVEVDGNRLVLYVPEGSDRATRERVLQRWHRDELRRAVPPLISRWEPVIGRSVSRWGIKRMKPSGVLATERQATSGSISN